VVGQHDAVVLPRLLGGTVGELVGAVRVVRDGADRPHVDGVVEGDQPDPVAEGVDQDGVLRVQVDDGVHVRAGAVGALVELPLARRPLGPGGDLAVQGHHAEVRGGQPVQPRAGRGHHELGSPRQPGGEVAAAGQHQSALHRQAAHLDELVDHLRTCRGCPHAAK
jgi:hypothetical protein